jgi:23S rRNA pseudouridine2605 synthase
MTKRTVVRVAARGYVDGRYIGEEKEVIEAIDPSGRGKRRGAGAGGGKGRGKAGQGQGQGKGQGARGKAAGNVAGKRGRGKSAGNVGARGDDIGNRVDAPRAPRGPRVPGDASRNKKRGKGAGAAPPVFGDAVGGNAAGGRRNQRGRGRQQGAQATGAPSEAYGNVAGNTMLGNAAPGPRAKRNRGGKRTPFRSPSSPSAATTGRTALISEVAETRRWGDEAKSGQFAEALAKEANVKRDRLHKVLAQSGHGSRRDMEIMISSGRVMVNGIVATTGTSVSPQDIVMVDHRPVKLKFGEELPRVLLYHKPDGEIVTTNDPGNRITVFDNLPRVENGKWMAIGRLDINTSGLLIFTTSGELANRLMHPRYEVEREYAVRTLGELTAEQQQKLLDGVSIATERDDDADDEDEVIEDRPAKFDSIEERGGEGVNRWYHVVIREGRNREVRKMFEAVGLTVSRLIRVRFGKIGLPPRLSRGRMMELAPEQVRAVLKWVGMEVEGRIGALPTNVEPKRNGPQSAQEREPRGPRQGRGGRDQARGASSTSGADVEGQDTSLNEDLQDNDFEPVDGRVADALLQGQEIIGEDGLPIVPSQPRGDQQRDPRDRKRGNRRGRRGRRDDRGPNTGVNAIPNADGLSGASNEFVGEGVVIAEGADAVAGDAGQSGQARPPRPPQAPNVPDERGNRRNRRGRLRRGRGDGTNANVDVTGATGATEPGNQISKAPSSTYDDDFDDNIGNRISAPPTNANALPGGIGAVRGPRGPRTPSNRVRGAGAGGAKGPKGPGSGGGAGGRNRRPRGGRGGSGGGSGGGEPNASKRQLHPFPGSASRSNTNTTSSPALTSAHTNGSRGNAASTPSRLKPTSTTRTPSGFKCFFAFAMSVRVWSSPSSPEANAICGSRRYSSGKRDIDSPVT